MSEEFCLIIDYGSQYTQLIARRLRELGVLSTVVSPEKAAEKLKLPELKAIILSGGPSSVSWIDSPKLPFDLQQTSTPVLGICYGMQLMAKTQGGVVVSGDSREYGVDHIEQTGQSKLFEQGFHSQVLLSHGDHVKNCPASFNVVAQTKNGVPAAIEHSEKLQFGVQFHPEVHHTTDGLKWLQKFLKLSGFQFSWKPAHIYEELESELRQKFKSGKILCALSGGVDSTVLAVFLNKVFPGQVECFCVDTGLLRKNELENLKKLFEDHFHFPIHFVDAASEFLEELRGITDPEKKRKIIGRVFIEVFEKEAKAHSDISFLAQGTLYPDVIESLSAHGGPTAKIKSHHNVGGLPERLPFELMEPFRLLFKDEVRRLGEYLGIPHDFVWRHPFPGPGLAVRVVGEVTRENLMMLKEADAILQNELKMAGWYEKLWQSFCVFLPVRSVGVMGDARTYENCVAVRCVHSEDGMTAHIAALPTELLERISSKIINQVKGINRVVYDISSKPPSTIEWE